MTLCTMVEDIFANSGNLTTDFQIGVTSRNNEYANYSTMPDPPTYSATAPLRGLLYTCSCLQHL